MPRQAQDLKAKPRGRPPKSPKFLEPVETIAEIKERIDTPIKKEYDFHCCACGLKTNKETSFPPSSSIVYTGNHNRLPICRKCLNDMFTVFGHQYSDYHDVYRRICMLWDIYYEDTLAETAFRNSDVSHKVTKYIGNLMKTDLCMKTYADTIKNDIVARNSETFTGLSPETTDVVKKKTIDFWGEGFSPEDYKYLEKTYKNWTDEVECNTPSEKALMKRICFNELQIHKAMLNGDQTYKLTDEFNKMLDSAKLQPKQNKVEALSENNTLGTMIKKWEDEEPIPKVLPEFEDVDGIKKYLSVWFLGHLCKMIGRKNKWSRLYDEEVAKYTVSKPEYNSEDDEIDYELIFGAEE